MVLTEDNFEEVFEAIRRSLSGLKWLWHRSIYTDDLATAQNLLELHAKDFDPVKYGGSGQNLLGMLGDQSVEKVKMEKTDTGKRLIAVRDIMGNGIYVEAGDTLYFSPQGIFVEEKDKFLHEGTTFFSVWIYPTELIKMFGDDTTAPLDLKLHLAKIWETKDFLEQLGP